MHTTHSAALYRAATLSERLAAGSRGAAHHADLERGRQRMTLWREQPPFHDARAFAERLDADGLTEERLAAALGEDDATLATRFAEPPAWAADLVRLLAGQRPVDDASALQARDEVEAAEACFTALFEPLVAAARRRVRDGLAALAHEHADVPLAHDELEPMLYASLPHALSLIVGRTLVLELNIARLTEQLEGATSAERFLSFVRRLRDPSAARALVEEYPVLARQAAVSIEQWAAASLEFASRLCRDWAELRNTLFSGRNPGRIARIQGGAGDHHRGGRSVLIVEFTCGERVVYKPRSLAAEARFGRLIEWLNERGAAPALRTLQVIDRGTHGWAEFIEAAECRSPAEVQRFYRRQGALLAVLHLLSATDMHFENIIAAGEHPMLVDLEALFHQRLPGPRHGAAVRGLQSSVMTVRLLPQLTHVEGIAEAVDFSGLGARPGQALPFREPYWENLGTDEMHLAEREARTSQGVHRPVFQGQAADLVENEDALATGFSDMYRLLAAHRHDLAADGGPLAAMAAVEVRFIARPTQTYAVLLHQGFHPDRLRDALDRDRFFDRLWARTEMFPALARLIAAERADLARNDIPLFTSRPASRHVWTSTGEVICDFFDRSCLDLVKERVARMCDDDLERQLWFVRTSIGLVRAERDGHSPHGEAKCRTNNAVSNDSGPASSDLAPLGEYVLLAAARAMGDRLARLAYEDEREAGWIGLNAMPGRGWSIGPLTLDPAVGAPLVALFLAELAAATGCVRSEVLARGAIADIRRQLAEPETTLELIGGPAALVSLIAVLAKIAATLGDGALAELAANLAHDPRFAGASCEKLDGAPPPRRSPHGIETPAQLAQAGRDLLHAARRSPNSNLAAA